MSIQGEMSQVGPSQLANGYRLIWASANLHVPGPDQTGK